MSEADGIIKAACLPVCARCECGMSFADFYDDNRSCPDPHGPGRLHVTCCATCAPEIEETPDE